jgi:tRNA uridine 5-carbamoylmethylation protein Kti12
MPGKIEWIEYEGKQILFNDRSNLSPEEIIRNVDEAVEMIKKSGKQEILYLIDNSNNNIIPKVKDHIKRAGKEVDPFILKTAVMGANQPQKVLLNLLNKITRMTIKIFNDPESAKKWLTGV